MKNAADEAVHAWLVMTKATLPLPVNTIGPIVNLTPGSISVAVDRLLHKGLVSRQEKPDDRRVRVVALTKRGRDVIAPIFKKHAELLRIVFSEFDARELREPEASLKKVGKQAARLLENG